MPCGKKRKRKKMNTHKKKKRLRANRHKKKQLKNIHNMTKPFVYNNLYVNEWFFY